MRKGERNYFPLTTNGPCVTLQAVTLPESKWLPPTVECDLPEKERGGGGGVTKDYRGVNSVER